MSIVPPPPPYPVSLSTFLASHITITTIFIPRPPHHHHFLSFTPPSPPFLVLYTTIIIPCLLYHHQHLHHQSSCTPQKLRHCSYASNTDKSQQQFSLTPTCLSVPPLIQSVSFSLMLSWLSFCPRTSHHLSFTFIISYILNTN